MPFTEVNASDKKRVVDVTMSPRVPATNPKPANLASVCEDFSQRLRESGLDYGDDHEQVVRTFVVSLATKGFVIFSGLSGSGKSRLAIALGQWFGTRRVHVEAVRPDWNSPSALLGFENIASETNDARYGWNVPRSLEFILMAARDQNHPYLLVLDEMNLAHVEYYFADVLSGMESGQPMVPNLRHMAGLWRLPLDEVTYIPWPKNLLTVGTINVDETTYTFSPKVLDRANTIEFRVPPGSLRSGAKAPRNVERGDPELVRVFLNRLLNKDPVFENAEAMSESLEYLHRMLYQYDFEFGYRLFRDALRFGSLMADAGEPDYRVALDHVIVQKIIPKFENAELSSPDALIALAVLAFPELGNSEFVDVLHPPEGTPVLPNTFMRIQKISRRRQR
jgi:5-methylcytosine-specific restriction protein B